MEGRAFSGRSGRVIAASRALLAIVFLLAVWFDPQQPARASGPGLAILSIYLAWSAVLVWVAWNSWWFDFRLGPLVHCVDIVASVLAVAFTEAPGSDFTSPFMAFSAFLLITATIRWGWRGTAMTAAGLFVLNSAMAGVLDWLDIAFDPYRFGRRTAYMILLSLIVIWLGVERRPAYAAALPEPPGLPGEQRHAILARALGEARTVFAADSAAIAFSGGEEPWIDLLRDDPSGCHHERIAPDELVEDIGTARGPILFDVKRRRAIAFDGRGRPLPLSAAIDLPLAAHYAVNEGLALTFSTAAGTGQLLLWGLRGPSSDDLPVAQALATEIGRALDRDEMARLAHSAVVADIRNSIARDLHDSVAQFLAGTLFRLEALRRWIRDGNDPEAEINAIKDALRLEQGQLRLMIDRLRRGEEGDRRTDLVDELGRLLGEIGLHWHIETHLDAQGEPLPVSIQLAHELRQIVREAVANAVRHGRCRRVELSVGQDGELLRLMIRDNGVGFPERGTPCRPRSISERVEALGGHLFLGTGRPGAHLDIELPMRIAA